MAKASWDGIVIAESDKYEFLEGNVYFPPESVKTEYLKDVGTDYECPWKGHSDYYDIVIGDKVNSDAAWSYPNPKPAANQIKGYFAFETSKGVHVDV